MSTSFLQEFRFASTQAGISTQKLESSLMQFTKRIGEATNGTGAAASINKDLGIELIAADGSIRSTEAVLNDVADALARMDSQAERAAAATAQFATKRWCQGY
ncbi:hypothetical protein CC99x_007785 [Candidatus Berkiella cookevillensis]|uniref:Uncharacterized protein n=1 Tax=Candidatus Berkiella cookevillensis TaxID=437022 RepID=A0A0Q9Y8R2_9GAMM|nr:hypothetical protein [Candidatus Berkiella cookevillensis]MCS5708803.1 hypothetical protein [Candidatus Berkiella cookevillensis]